MIDEISGVVGVKESTGSQMECHIEAAETAWASRSVFPKQRRSSFSHLFPSIISSFPTLLFLLSHKELARGSGMYYPKIALKRAWLQKQDMNSAPALTLGDSQEVMTAFM